MKKAICAMLLALILLCAAAHAEYTFEDGYRIIAGKDGRYGLENEQGEAVLETVYDEIGPFETWPDGNKRCWLIQDGKYGWYSAGGEAVACTFDWQPQPFSAYVIFNERIFSLDGSPANETLYAQLTVLDDHRLAAWEFTGSAQEWEELGSGWGARSECASEEAVILDANLNPVCSLQCDFIDPAGESLLCAFMDFDVDPAGEKWDAGYIDLSTGDVLCRKRTDLDLGEFRFGYARVFRNGPGGANLIDRSFEKLLPRDYAWITNFTGGYDGGAYAMLCDEIWDENNITGHRCTLINEKLETLMTFDVGLDLNGLWCNGEIIVNDGDYGLYYVHDMNARLLLKGKYVGALTGDGLVRYQSEAGLWGYISPKGKNVIPAQYADALDFSDGYAAVQDAQGKWQFIDGLGRNFFETSWDYVESFRDGYAYVRNGDDGWMINLLGERVRPRLAQLCGVSDAYNPYVPVSEWSGEIAQVYAEHHGMRIFLTGDGKYGVMDRDGKILAPGVYDRIDPPADFGGGVYRAVLERNGRKGWVGSDGFCDSKWAVCSDQVFAGLTIVSEEGGDGFYNEPGSVYLLADAAGNSADGVEYAAADILENGLLALREVGSDITFVVDGAFRQVFSLECDEIAFAGDGMCAYKAGGLWGLCDLQGNVRTPAEHAMRFTFSDGYAVVTRYTDRDGEQRGLMNLQGEMAVPFGKYENIYGFRDGYCIIQTADHSYPEEDEYGTFIRPWHDYIIVDASLNTCASFTGNSHAISKNGLFVYFDRDESVMIDAAGREIFRADGIGDYSHGYYRYQESGLWGFLDETGKIAIPAQYADAGDFSDNGLAPVQDESGWKYIHADGETAFSVHGRDACTFYNGLANVDYEWYINEAGEIVAPLEAEWW